MHPNDYEGWALSGHTPLVCLIGAVGRSRNMISHKLFASECELTNYGHGHAFLYILFPSSRMWGHNACQVSFTTKGESCKLPHHAKFILIGLRITTHHHLEKDPLNSANYYHEANITMNHLASLKFNVHRQWVENLSPGFLAFFRPFYFLLVDTVLILDPTKTRTQHSKITIGIKKL